MTQPPHPRLAPPLAPRPRNARVPRVQKAGAQVGEHRLENGLRVLIAERHADPVVAALLYYRVGARNESEREAGVSHFLEHMMFKGTSRLGKGEVDRVTAELGGQNNAFTGYDHTAYWFEFASDRWERALDIEADRMHGLTLDAGEFDAERAVVLEELAMGEDDPWRVLARHVEAAVFPRHPYGRPIIGYPDTLRALTPADMRAYYERFYHPGNATLVLCGDVEPASALRAVEERFGALSRGPAFEAADCFRPPLEPPPGEVRLRLAWDDPGKRLCMAWATAPVGSDEDYALDLAATILTSGRLSRLHRRLVLEQRLATTVSASNDTRVDGGIFWILAECAQGVEPAALEAAIDHELAVLASEPVSAPERRRALGLLAASEAYDAETVSDVAEELGEYAVDYDWRMSYDGGARHRAVTAGALRRTVARLFARERRVVGWSLPQAQEQAAPAARKRGTRKRPAKRKASGKAAKPSEARKTKKKAGKKGRKSKGKKPLERTGKPAAKKVARSRSSR